MNLLDSILDHVIDGGDAFIVFVTDETCHVPEPCWCPACIAARTQEQRCE